MFYASSPPNGYPSRAIRYYRLRECVWNHLQVIYTTQFRGTPVAALRTNSHVKATLIHTKTAAPVREGGESLSRLCNQSTMARLQLLSEHGRQDLFRL